jgi:hypothetical protein
LVIKQKDYKIYCHKSYMWAGGMAQVAQCLLSKCKALSSKIKSYMKLGGSPHTLNHHRVVGYIAQISWTKG